MSGCNALIYRGSTVSLLVSVYSNHLGRNEDNFLWRDVHIELEALIM